MSQVTRIGIPAAFLIFSCLLCPVFCQGSTARGDWVVDDAQTLTGTTIWEGNITVESGGYLTITGATLIFNSTNTSHRGIFVEQGGRIKVENSWISTVNESNGFVFYSNGSVEISGSRFEYIFGTTVGIVWIGGFRVTSDDPVVEGSQFIDAMGFGPRFEGCENVVFRDNTVTRCSTGLLFEESNGVIQGNIFTNNTDRQVVIRGCELVSFINNTVNLTGMGGLIVTRTGMVETSGNYYEGSYYVIYASNGSTISMDGEYIIGDQIQVESRDNSDVLITDSVLDINRVNTVSGSSVSIKRHVKIRVVSGNENPVSGALVKVLDPDKELVANGTTNDDGIVQFLLSVADVTVNPFKPSEPDRELFGPYDFRALKGIYSASGSANITTNYNLEVKLQFPWIFVGGAAGVVVLIAVIVLAPPSGGRSKKR